MLFHALTVDVAKGRCLKPYDNWPRVKLLPRDRANIYVKT